MLRIDATRLLLIELGDLGPIRTTVELLALGAVELEGLPGLAEVGALEDGQGVGTWRTGAEGERYVGQLVLLAQREGQGDIVRRRGVRIVGHIHRPRSPAGHIARIIEIGEGRGTISLGFACSTLAGISIAEEFAIPLRLLGATYARCLDGITIGGVHKTWQALARLALEVAGIVGRYAGGPGGSG